VPLIPDLGRLPAISQLFRHFYLKLFAKRLNV
jgi:hypothetical protein